MKMFNRKVADSIPAGVNGFFIDIKSFRLYCVPGVDSAASNRNEYQEYFLGVKSGRCVRVTTLPPSCAVVTKSENLNFLESPGTVQACNGTANEGREHSGRAGRKEGKKRQKIVSLNEGG